MRTHKLVNTDRSSPPSAFYTYPLFFYPSIFVYPLLFLHLSSVSKSPSVLLFFLLLHIYIFLNPLHPHLSLNHYHPSAAGFLLQRHPPPPLSIPLFLSLSLYPSLPLIPSFFLPGSLRREITAPEPDRALAALNQPLSPTPQMCYEE